MVASLVAIALHNPTGLSDLEKNVRFGRSKAESPIRIAAFRVIDLISAIAFPVRPAPKSPRVTL
jgi:hypothetical protein